MEHWSLSGWDSLTLWTDLTASLTSM
uniref:Uncharacterized protein n=1 Tax=Anguilla anguilla TaxID=7936 RepID=A0A0E9VZP0_ANGAN